MSIETLNRITKIDHLIRIKGTGTPKQLAQRVNISESTLYLYISRMKEMGAPIAYDSSRNTYFYQFDGKFNFRFIGAEDSLHNRNSG